MSKRPEYLTQEQGVLEEPVRDLEEEDEDEALDDLEKAALAMGMDPSRMTEADGRSTDID